MPHLSMGEQNVALVIDLGHRLPGDPDVRQEQLVAAGCPPRLGEVGVDFRKRSFDDEDVLDEMSISGDLRRQLAGTLLEVEPVSDVVRDEGRCRLSCDGALPQQ